MRHALLSVATLAWGLWVGGTIATFVFGLYYFHHLPHDTFADAANAMFAAFAPYQLAVAGVALAAAGLAFVSYPSRWTVALLACLLAAGCLAVIFGLGLLPILQGMRAKGMAGSAPYMKLHGQSMITMSIQALILLATGPVLLAAMAVKPKPVVVTTDADDARELAGTV